MFNSCLYNCIYSLNVFNFGVLAFVLLSRCLNFNNFEDSLSLRRVYGSRMDCNIKNEKTIPPLHCDKNVILMVFNFYLTSLIFFIRNYSTSVIFLTPPLFFILFTYETGFFIIQTIKNTIKFLSNNLLSLIYYSNTYHQNQ